MKIAVEGCCHGELDKIYESLAFLEDENNFKVDLLIICGDFQAVRNCSDLNCMAVPPRYRKLNTFYKYYSGEKKAPVLTIFIGGNHEASNYLSELFYGGWVCPNIYYLGRAGVINVGGIRIAGLSGIYKGTDYLKGHYEIPPYSQSTVRSIYHVRNLEVFRLKQLKDPVDIFISHDWPRGVYNYGDLNQLLRRKPFFRDEVEQNTLGSRPAQELMNKLKPNFWFAAHLHCKFAALVPHEPSKAPDTTYTKFLALDKCLPRRNFLQILDIGDPVKETPPTVKYDIEWLCILRSTNHLLNLTNNSCFMPGPGCSDRWDFAPLQEELRDMKATFNNNFDVPKNFHQTAEAVCERDNRRNGNKMPEAFVNPQTTDFCRKVGITDPLALLVGHIVSPPAPFAVKDFTFTDENEEDVTALSQPSLNLSQQSLDSSDGEDTAENSNVVASCSSSDERVIVSAFTSSSAEQSPRAAGLDESAGRTSPTTESDVVDDADSDEDVDDGMSPIGSCFVIDRKGSRSIETPRTKSFGDLSSSETRKALHLEFCTSSPVHSTPRTCVSDTETFPKFKSDESSFEDPGSDRSASSGNGTKRAVGNDSILSCIKRMRRRNHAIYDTSTDEGEERD